MKQTHGMQQTHGEPLIEWVLGCYGYLMPFNTRHMTGPELAALIRESYDCGTTGDGPINETAAKIAERRPGIFSRVNEVLSYNYPATQDATR